MKTVIGSLAILLWFSASPADACKKGEIEFNGNCASMPSPETSTLAPMLGSDEKPPRSGKPSYEAEGIQASTQPSCAATHNCSDQKAIDAEKKGKEAAGVPER